MLGPHRCPRPPRPPDRAPPASCASPRRRGRTRRAAEKVTMSIFEIILKSSKSEKKTIK